MCGFVCTINSDPQQPADLIALKAMSGTLVHRGPDDEGYLVHDNVGLGHRRLSIIDRSEAGRQPIVNESGTVGVVFNGEIYNYLSLRTQLIKAGHEFRSNTDTETLVHAYEQWGLDFLGKLDGMFSLALLDRARGKCILAKDPFGKKPLYYALSGGNFLAASELKAIAAHSDFEGRLNLGAVGKYMAHDYVPTPHTIYTDCWKLLPGSYLEISTHELKPLPEPIRYFIMDFEPKLEISEADAVDEFITLFRSSVAKRLMSDVPLGVFLSGGIDSSSIVATLAKMVAPSSLNTFCIGFRESSFDESRYARQVADYFGTTHHERMFQASDVLNVIPKLVDTLDEPFADPSILPTYLLSEFTREKVTVALGGDGGDEILAGYDPFAAHRSVKMLGPLGRPAFGLLRICSGLLPASESNMSSKLKIRFFLQGIRTYARRDCELRNTLWMSTFDPEAQSMLFSNPKAVGTSWRLLFSETLSNRAISLNLGVSI